MRETIKDFVCSIASPSLYLSLELWWTQQKSRR